MPIIIYKEYTATRSGSVVKNVTCEKCRRPFSYEMQRTVEGSGSSPFFLTNERAQRQANDRAESHLAATLEHSEDVVPCPHCGWTQQSMVRIAISQGQCGILGVLAWSVLIGGGILTLGLNSTFRRSHERPVVYVFGFLTLLLWLVFLLLYRSCRRQHDPNRTWKMPAHLPALPKQSQHNSGMSISCPNCDAPLSESALQCGVCGLTLPPRGVKTHATDAPALPNQESLSWIDQQLIQTNWFMLIALTALFFALMWIFSGCGLLLGKHPIAREKAKVLFVICSLYAVFAGIAIYALIHSRS